MINMLLIGVPANIMALAGLVFAFVMTCLLLARCNDSTAEGSGKRIRCQRRIVRRQTKRCRIYIYSCILLQLLYCFVN